ncbi:MAG: bifunctional glutamate N-acetyltransferase/amino-acid acetyltransferase ArgJ [Desulfuromonadales bacterium]|nr:bifunctional glutamate N-acetyltransferase/amino-acid acetyltransferase ArgJ [Desulfuromonadales bacterium]
MQNLKIKGFRFAACAAGIKKSGKLDLGLIVSSTPARCAAVYTTNKVVAAPIVITRDRLAAGYCQAILVNSGNANACTGAAGHDVALQTADLVAAQLQIPVETVAIASTGVIGQLLPLAPFATFLPPVVAALAEDRCADVAEAIRTTDAYPKIATAAGRSAGNLYNIVAIAKGAGMIHPNMATMLAFVMTDAQVAPDLLDAALRRAVDASFNSITVDRDTSTNDMVLLLANGASGGAEIQGNTPDGDAFAGNLAVVLLELAKLIVKDGEGATKVVEIEVRGGRDDAQARQAAMSVATSSLVKTAFFGEDANWGRIIAAVGYSGAEINPERVAISFGEIPVVRDGISTGVELEAQATAVLKQPEFKVTIDLHLGNGLGRYYTSDLTYDYVKCNASYRS